MIGEKLHLVTEIKVGLQQTYSDSIVLQTIESAGTGYAQFVIDIMSPTCSTSVIYQAKRVKKKKEIRRFTLSENLMVTETLRFIPLNAINYTVPANKQIYLYKVNKHAFKILPKNLKQYNVQNKD